MGIYYIWQKKVYYNIYCLICDDGAHNGLSLAKYFSSAVLLHTAVVLFIVLPTDSASTTYIHPISTTTEWIYLCYHLSCKQKNHSYVFSYCAFIFVHTVICDYTIIIYDIWYMMVHISYVYSICSEIVVGDKLAIEIV